LNLAKRLHYGITGFDYTTFFYSTPYSFTGGFSRQGLLATQRYTGGTVLGQYPLDKFRRLEMSAGVIRQAEQFDDPTVEAQIRAQYAAAGVPFYLNNGTLVPIGLNLVQETTRFASFGPLSGSTFSIGGEVSFAGLRRETVQADLRKYLRIGSTSMLLAVRGRGFYSAGDNPQIFYFGGNQELRGYPYLSFSGNEGFFANVELRLPVINLAATPLGIIGPLRGTLFGGIGGAKYSGQKYQFSTSSDGNSYVNDPVFGEPVSGFHLVDGRASYGIGLQLFFLGYPLHFDWSKLTDLKVVSHNTQFDFWIGFDF
jgi:outer membrane protein assembly factor BamA